eukprot:1139852-Pelagomonas_calceolata.AAC.6
MGKDKGLSVGHQGEINGVVKGCQWGVSGNADEMEFANNLKLANDPNLPQISLLASNHPKMAHGSTLRPFFTS